MNSREVALNLRDGFLRASRSKLPPEIQLITDGLYNLNKLFGLYDAAEVDYQRFPVVPWQIACAGHEIVDPARKVIWQAPTQNDHYVFQNSNKDYDYVPALRLLRLSGAFMSYDITRPGQPEFYFFTSAGEAINGLFFGGKPFLEDPGLRVDGPCVFADDFFVRFNICHLLFDKLPRIHAANTLAGVKTALLFGAPSYVHDLCGLLGVAVASPRLDQRRGTIALRDCVIFSDSFNQLKHPGRFGGPWHLGALDKVRDALGQTLDGPKRYFLQRRTPLPRAIENEQVVAEILSSYGFSTGDPTTMTPVDQMRMFLNVEVLGGVHGAGLANLAFQKAGGTVIELLPPLCATHAYWAMSQKCNLRYRHLVCDDPELGSVDALNRKHDVKFNRRNVVVPEAAFEALLSDLFG